MDLEVKIQCSMVHWNFLAIYIMGSLRACAVWIGTLWTALVNTSHYTTPKLCQRINWALFCLQSAVYNAGCIIPYAAICYRAKQAQVFLGRMMQFISTEVHYELPSFASITCQSTPWPRLLICVHPYIIGQLKEFHNFIIKELKKANKTEQIYKGTFSLLNKLMLYVRAPLAAPVVPV